MVYTFPIWLKVWNVLDERNGEFESYYKISKIINCTRVSVRENIEFLVGVGLFTLQKKYWGDRIAEGYPTKIIPTKAFFSTRDILKNYYNLMLQWEKEFKTKG